MCACLMALKPSGRDWFEWILCGTSFGDGSASTKALFQLSFACEASQAAPALKIGRAN
jgi:hypothetical protein